MPKRKPYRSLRFLVGLRYGVEAGEWVQEKLRSGLDLGQVAAIIRHDLAQEIGETRTVHPETLRKWAKQRRKG